MAKLIRVNGRLSKNLPTKANKIARAIKPKKINFLSCFDIFFEDVLAINLDR